MPADLTPDSMTFGGSLDEGAVSVSIFRTSPPGEASAFTVVNYGYGDGQGYTAASGTPQAEGDAFQLSRARVAIDLPGHDGSLSQAVVDLAFAAFDAGQLSGHLTYLSPDAHQSDAASLVATRVGGADYIVVSATDGSGITLAARGPDGTLTPLDTVADSADSYAAGVSDLVTVTTNGQTFVYAGSATEHGISGHRIDPAGVLDPVDEAGMQDSVPLMGVTAMTAAEVGGSAFVIAGGAGSHSLTVFEVGSDGALTPTDHVIDSLDTRFGGVTQIDTAEVGGITYVVAGGADEGLTLFALTPDGDLVTLDTIADTGDTALAGVSALALTVEGDTLVIHTTAEGEPGLGRITYDTSGAGSYATSVNGSVTGGGQDDLLLDGFAADLMDGGAGADVFILRPDGETDRITGLVPGQDRIDMTAFPMFRSVDQLQITSTATGAEILYQGELLILDSADGEPLTIEEVREMVAPDISRFDVVRAPLEVSEPEPMPVIEAPTPPPPSPDEPDPDPVPGGGGPEFTVLTGTMMSDRLTGSDGRDLIYGGDGDDRIDGGAGDDELHGEAGNDEIFGRDGADLISGGSGDDSISGGAGADRIWGGSGDDIIGGSDGIDEVSGEAGNDSLGGGLGNDILDGGSGNDMLGGGDGDDRVSGGTGHDFVAGGAGNDTLFGGGGQDILNGGAGNDTLTGGADADLFVFNDFRRGEVDRITDFQDGLDQIRLTGVPSTGGMPSVQVTNVTGGVEIALEGHVIMIEGLSAANLDDDDFILI